MHALSDVMLLIFMDYSLILRLDLIQYIVGKSIKVARFHNHSYIQLFILLRPFIPRMTITQALLLLAILSAGKISLIAFCSLLHT